MQSSSKQSVNSRLSASHAGKRLLILGGNRYNVPSLKAAKESGFFLMVADRNPSAAGLSLADVFLPIDLFAYDDLLAAVKANGGVDGIVSMAEAGVRPMADLSSKLVLSNITPQAAKNATSKAAMRRAWADSPYSVPFRIVHTIEEAYEAGDELGYPCIMKPDRSFGGSRGVNRLDCHCQVGKAFEFAKSEGLPDSDVIMEDFIDGSEHSIETLIYNGEVSILCISEKFRNEKAPYPYRVDVSIQYPAALSDTTLSEIGEMARFAVKRIGLTQGCAHIEFAIHQAKPVLFELGARCGGGHTPQIAYHVSGVNEFIEYCRMACGLPPIRFRPLQQRGADYRFLSFNAGIIHNICIPDVVRNHPCVYDVDITMKPGDVIHPLRTSADRAGFVVCLAQTRAEAAALGEWTQEKIKIKYT